MQNRSFIKTLLIWDIARLLLRGGLFDLHPFVKEIY